MGGCASSKPKVKDEDREPYGAAATKSDGRQKSGEGSKSKSKQQRSSAGSSSRDPGAPSGAQPLDNAAVPVQQQQQQRQQAAPAGKPETTSADVGNEVSGDVNRNGTI
jgi:hypothetical protein